LFADDLVDLASFRCRGKPTRGLVAVAQAHRGIREQFGVRLRSGQFDRSLSVRDALERAPARMRSNRKGPGERSGRVELLGEAHRLLGVPGSRLEPAEHLAEGKVCEGQRALFAGWVTVSKGQRLLMFDDGKPPRSHPNDVPQVGQPQQEPARLEGMAGPINPGERLFVVFQC
jgi:hypothetical protein